MLNNSVQKTVFRVQCQKVAYETVKYLCLAFVVLFGVFSVSVSNFGVLTLLLLSS